MCGVTHTSCVVLSASGWKSVAQHNSSGGYMRCVYLLLPFSLLQPAKSKENQLLDKIPLFLHQSSLIIFYYVACDFLFLTFVLFLLLFSTSLAFLFLGELSLNTANSNSKTMRVRF